MSNFFSGDSGDDVGSGDEHLGRVFNHDDEIGESGGVGVAAGAGAHDDGDLWHDSGRFGVGPESLSDEVKGDCAVLDAGAGTFVKPHEGASGGDGQFHNFDHFFAIDFAQSAAEDSAVLAEDTYFTPVDRAPAGDDAIGCGAT